MTPDQAAMVAFLRQQYADDVTMSRTLGNAIVTGAGDGLGLPPGAAEKQARIGVHAAETRARFFEDTVVPYLGTAGPTGRIADQQLRLLAWEHAGVRGYDDTWRP